jgi:hypothetical protein
MSSKPHRVVGPAELREKARHYRELAADLGPGLNADTLRGFAHDYVEMAETLESRATADRESHGEE